MNIFKNIISFFKKIFNKENNTKMIEAPVQEIKKSNKKIFVNSLKANIVPKREKNKIETLTCVGDGLGIQDKISY